MNSFFLAFANCMHETYVRHTYFICHASPAFPLIYEAERVRKSESVKEREWQGLHNKTVCNHQLIVVNANIVRSAIAVAHAAVFIFGNYFRFVSISWFMPNFRPNVQRKLRTFLFFRSSFMFWMSLCTYGDQEIAAIKRVLRKNGEKKLHFIMASLNLELRKSNCLHNLFSKYGSKHCSFDRIDSDIQFKQSKSRPIIF